MTPAAWITFIAVSTVLYGGFIVCVIIAIKRSREHSQEKDESGV